MGDPKESTNVAGRNTIGQDLSRTNNSDWKIEKLPTINQTIRLTKNNGRKIRNNGNSASMSTANKDFKG